MQYTARSEVFRHRLSNTNRIDRPNINRPTPLFHQLHDLNMFTMIVVNPRSLLWQQEFVGLTSKLVVRVQGGGHESVSSDMGNRHFSRGTDRWRRIRYHFNGARQPARRVRGGSLGAKWLQLSAQLGAIAPCSCAQSACCGSTALKHRATATKPRRGLGWSQPPRQPIVQIAYVRDSMLRLTSAGVK